MDYEKACKLDEENEKFFENIQDLNNNKDIIFIIKKGV